MTRKVEIRVEPERETVVDPDRSPRPRDLSGPRIGRGPILSTPGPGETRPVLEFVPGNVHGVVLRPLTIRRDGRGWLVELFRHDEIDPDLHPVMAYASMTLPGVVRGPHEHRDQTDGFAFIGPSDFRVWVWDARPDSPTFAHRDCWDLGQSRPAALWVPPGVVHAYRNIGQAPGLVFNAPNRLYAGPGKTEPVDEIRHEDEHPCRFPLT